MEIFLVVFGQKSVKISGELGEEAQMLGGKGIMSKGYTEIIYILDRSGSMGGLESDTIGGFNSMMEQQKKTGEKAVVSTVLFDDVCEVIHDRVPIEKIAKLTDKQYYMRGCTALLDAVGGAIHHIGNVRKARR